MTTSDPDLSGLETDVCVVGGGATALYGALLCARAGRSVVLVSPEPGFEAAGAGISPLLAPPTLGLLAASGIDEQLVAAGRKVLGVDDHGSTGMLSSWRYADHAGIARPYGLTVPTGTTVQALLAELRAQPGATVLTGEGVVSVEQDGQRVLLGFGRTVEQDGGVPARRRIAARYAVAADGRQSALRELVGVRLEVSAFDRTAWLLVAPDVPGRESVLLVRHRAPRALFTIPTPGPSSAIVWSPDKDQEEQLEQGGPAALAEQIKEVDPELSEWLGTVGGRTSPVMRLGFSLWRAPSWRVGRVLLVGESVHGLHTLGGQGLNQSLQGAASAARAIDAALASGDPAAIEEYERVRRPHVERLQDLQWNLQALGYGTAPAVKGAHEDFIDVMTALPAELVAQLAGGDGRP
ncbi:NAD(P)/FAD-dependent oxidoreductase [Streptomyces sp. NPDC048161]|uniref:FAD-dependent oxidoreductase n=1 Tax=Streptomyces sp. NPDC048161 TaxID=3160985 RepID=UPI0033F61511